jgi:FAD/FMN-containing dehydrogenase
VAEAGMTVAAVQAAATGMGRLFALSLASEGSAQLGGVLATNAGGLNVLRYGNARDLVLGIEAVLADGTVLNGLKRLRKDNTGYDLRHLLIGSEGTLGVITAASLRLFTPPADLATALLMVGSPQAALDLLDHAQARLPGMVQAFELINRQAVQFLHETGLGGRFAESLDLSNLPEWMVLIELGLPEGFGAAATHLEALFAQGLDLGLCTDGTLAQNRVERAEMWRLREDIPWANRKIGALASHDISLPLLEIPGFVGRMPARLAQVAALRVNAFGHLGDGNLHYNLFPTKGQSKADYPADQRALLTRIILDAVDALGGSVSAEHGLGRLKAGELQRYGDPGKLAAMRAIKGALDPHGILNPGAVLV